MPRFATSICCLILLAQCSTLAAQPPRFRDRADEIGRSEPPFRGSQDEVAVPRAAELYDPSQSDASPAITLPELSGATLSPSAVEANHVHQASYHAGIPDTPSKDGIAAAAGEDPTNELAKPVPLARPSDGPPLPLAKPGARNKVASGGGMMPPLMTIGGSLAVVLGLFFVAAWLLKRGMPRGALALPSEVVEVLGSTALPSRQQAYLVRCGSKLLLVAVGTAGSETLTEITDPIEVDRLAGICRQAHPQSATAAFRNILQQFGGERDDEFAETPTAPRRLPTASIVGNRPRGREDADV